MGRGGLPQGIGPIALGGGAALIVIIILVLLISKACGGTASAQGVDCSRKPPAPPSGYQYASKYCVTTDSTLLDGKHQLQGVPLSDRTATRGMTLFAYNAGKWTPLTPVALDASGTSVSASVPVPKAFAVLRRASGGIVVLGAVPKGQQPSSEAAGVLTDVVPQVYVPAADGSISGGPLAPTSGAGYGTIASVSEPANNADAAQAVATILGDPNKITSHVNAIVAQVAKDNDDGVEIDYPAIDSALKSNFTQFIQALSTQLHQAKKQLVVRMPLPRQEGNNWNTFAYDWATIGKSADLLVMAVEHDQSVYRQRVPSAVQYLTQQVDAKKLLLEISPYAEDRSDQGVVTTLSTASALAIAGQITVRDPQNVYVNQDVQVAAENINRESGSGPTWTPQGVVSFNYSKGAEQHTVWLENVYSAGYKLEIAQLYHLGGVAVDNATADPTLADIWPAVQQFAATGAPPLAQPNPQTLKPEWQADGKAIPDAANRAVITWHTPSAPGPHDLSVTVSEGTMRVTSTTRVVVKAGTPPAGIGGTPLPGATNPARASSATATATATSSR
jgi:hypothetical protein